MGRLCAQQTGNNSNPTRHARRRSPGRLAVPLVARKNPAYGFFLSTCRLIGQLDTVEGAAKVAIIPQSQFHKYEEKDSLRDAAMEVGHFPILGSVTYDENHQHGIIGYTLAEETSTLSLLLPELCVDAREPDARDGAAL